MNILVIFLLILIILKLISQFDEVKKNPYNYLSKNINEFFVLSVKDRQKIGTMLSDDGKQPKSTWRNGNNINVESCYSTETRNGNSTGRNRNFWCNQGNDGGEVIPSEGLYNLDFTNYNIHMGRAARGKKLSGSYNLAKSYNFIDGLAQNENIISLSDSKSICDRLKEKCPGFILVTSTKDSQETSKTIFLSTLEEGWEDPDAYAKLIKENITSSNIVSYIKKDLNFIEKSVSDDLFKNTSNKYINLPTCNWKSANRCIFKDYKYDQSRNECKNDSNPIQNYNQSEINNYDSSRFANFLMNKANNDIGNDKLTSDEANVRDYINRCKDVDGFEFLSNIELPIQYVPTTKSGDVKGRYIRITINNRNPNENWLQLAEVQIINNNKNIALGKNTSSSGNYPGSSNSNANDGNNNGNWGGNSVYHSNNDSPHYPGSPQFWEVDLGDATRTIDRIIVSNRTDCCRERLSNWLLSIYDNNKNLIWARIFPNHPNPKVIIDIKASDNDMNNIRVKDYEQTRFNKYYYRISDTEFNSKTGRNSDCDQNCHKNICEGEKKKWIGNNDHYGCRDYKSGEREKEIADDLERKRKEEERIRRESAKVTFSAQFVQWQTPSHDVQASWVNFRRKLTGVYDTMHISNNLGERFKVTDPRVNQLAHALRDGRHGFRIDLGGKTWTVFTGCVSWSSWQRQDQVYLTTDPWECSCGIPGEGHWTIRPMINNYNWGGGPRNGYHSCFAPTQTLTLEFSNTLNIEPPFISEINKTFNVDLIQSLFGTNRQLNLLYKATRDGWAAGDFHSRCDRKGATLTIVRNKNGSISGGYTPISWESRHAYVHVNPGDAFLFSVSSGNVSKFLNTIYPQYSMFDYPWYGPTFGGGHDLNIKDMANQNDDRNYSNPHSYSGTRIFGTGSYFRFTVNEVEVYQVL